MKALALGVSLALTLGFLSYQEWLGAGIFAIVSIILYYSDFNDEWE
jgi:hypothetical protein